MTAGRQTISQKKDWGTPKKYVLAIKKFFNGQIHLDPCSNDYSIVDAINEYILPTNGLKESWEFPNIYVNPPYGRAPDSKTSIKNWLAKCSEANTKYKSEVLALIPVAVNTDHWKKYIFIKAEGVCFLYDTRLKFLENGEDTGKGAPMACAIVYWGKNYKKFFSHFIEYGAVVDLRELRNLADIGVKKKKADRAVSTKTITVID